MIFSAVALVAFSFAGMANEVEEKEERLIVRNNCDVFADGVYNNQINEGCSVEEAHEASIGAYNDCISLHNKHNISLTEA
jgi:hypothetical protein